MSRTLRRVLFVVTVTAVTSVATGVLVLQQPDMYVSTGTFVVRPRALETTDELRAVDTLIRGAEINATYAAVASSETIRGRAESSLDPSVVRLGMNVTADVLTGTNVVSISAEGPDPGGAYELATAVGAQTLQYVQRLGDLYQLQPLDPPRLPRAPAGPPNILTVSMGVMLGGLLAAGLVFAWDRIRTPGSAAAEGIEGIPGVASPTAAEVRARLAELEDSGEPFSVGLLWIRPTGDRRSSRFVDLGDPSRITALLDPSLGKGDLLGHVGGGRYVALLAGMPPHRAKGLMTIWELAVEAALAGGNGHHPDGREVRTSVSEYRDTRFSGEHEATEAALTLARPTARGRVRR